MKRKCFISFKTEDETYKKTIQNDLDVDMIDKSLNDPINSDDEDYIMRKIREDYLNDSTVTIHLIGKHSSENDMFQNQNFIKRELQASLYTGSKNSKNGILGVVLPEVIDLIYTGSHKCSTCNETHNYVNINDDTTIKEFSYNFYVPKDTGCGWGPEDRYCILVKWDDFVSNPNKYIELAYQKKDEPIAKKTKVRP